MINCSIRIEVELHIHIYITLVSSLRDYLIVNVMQYWRKWIVKCIKLHIRNHQPFSELLLLKSQTNTWVLLRAIVLASTDIMLLHPYSIDRKEIKLKTFLSLFHFLLREKLDINHCWGYFTIPHELLAFDLWLEREKIVYNVTIKP